MNLNNACGALIPVFLKRTLISVSLVHSIAVTRNQKMSRRARHHYYYYGANAPSLVGKRDSMLRGSSEEHCFESEAPFSAYMRIVRWLYEAVGPNDPRGFEPRPMFRFAVRYNLLQEDPAEIYRQYVAYQCHVYAEAADHLSADRLNNSTFGDIQTWYENVREQNTFLANWEIL